MCNQVKSCSKQGRCHMSFKSEFVPLTLFLPSLYLWNGLHGVVIYHPTYEIKNLIPQIRLIDTVV